MKEQIKALIVDDVESMRTVLKKLLTNFEQIEVGRWRIEPTSVEKLADDLRLGVKG